jgi:hypothetical protein
MAGSPELSQYTARDRHGFTASWRSKPGVSYRAHILTICLQIKMNALRSMVDLVDTVEQVHEIYLNQNRDVTKQSAYNKVNTIFRELDVVRKSVVGELRGFESVDMESPGSLVALDTPEGERALFKFRLCLLYHNLRMLASLPLLSFLVWQGLTQQRASVDQQVLSDLAGQCVASAETTVSVDVPRDRLSRLTRKMGRFSLSTFTCPEYRICHS